MWLTVKDAVKEYFQPVLWMVKRSFCPLNNKIGDMAITTLCRIGTMFLLLMVVTILAFMVLLLKELI